MTNPLELADRMEAGEDVLARDYALAVGLPYRTFFNHDFVWADDRYNPTITIPDNFSHTNLQDLLDLFKHVLPGWYAEITTDGQVDLYRPKQRPPHSLPDFGAYVDDNPTTAFAIAMLRAVGGG